MRRALIFGASGQIGRPLLARLQARGWELLAVSRSSHADSEGLRWLRGDCSGVAGLPARIDAILSCGPLDAFARWCADAPVAAPRVVAFGSTSVQVKQDSADPVERDLAARLRGGESGVFAAAHDRGAAATLLRPTLVYGAGRDRTLTRIAALARRSGFFVLPRGATGLRQPVHVDDLAEAACAAIDADASHGQAYAMPGGESLPYREMVARVLASQQPRARLLEVPVPLFSAAVALARAGGCLQDFGDGALARMREDLVFDGGPAQRDLGYAPRVFHPTARMFVS
ncbi:NAD-dependent epimerase/dehydratase family protein [soil metagenome]